MQRLGVPQEAWVSPAVGVDQRKARNRGKGGINWYRYQNVILQPLLLPFVKERGPDTLVQEDNAPSHAHHYQARTHSTEQVQRLLWCPNSPDLNLIEPCWLYMKRNITRKEAPKSRATGMEPWVHCWKDLPQPQIQLWIERVPVHIKQIIQLER